VDTSDATLPQPHRARALPAHRPRHNRGRRRLAPLRYGDSLGGRTGAMVIGFGVLALVVIALPRGRLGYQTYRQDVLVPATAHGKGEEEMIEGK
jgi:hypothetical protein